MSTTIAVSSDGAAPNDKMSKRQINEALTGLMMGMFVAILAGTIVSTALVTIVEDFGGTSTALAWIVTAELLAMTATVPLWGKAADRYNNKLLLQASLALFVVGSLLAGFSHNMELLIASRVVQGIGAGGLTALVQIVMAQIIPPRELGKYSGLFGAIFGVGTVAGPLIGGFITEASWLGWRWTFFAGVPFALLAIALLQATLKLPTVRKTSDPIDWWGAAFLVAGVSTFLVWVSLAGSGEGKLFDWGSAVSYLLVAAAVLLIAVAVLIESKAKDPIIPLALFRNRTVTLAVVASVFVGIAMFGGTVYLATYFQVAHLKSPTQAGLLVLPMVFGLLVTSTVAGLLITKFGKWKRYLVAGGALLTIGLLLLSTIGADTSLWIVGAYMAVLGAGVGMLMQNLVLASQNDVPAAMLGAATSVLSFFRSLGGAIGVAVLGAVMSNRLISHGITGGAALPNPGAVDPSMLDMIRNAYGDSIADVFLVAAPLAFIAFLAVLFIKEKPLKTESGLERREHEATVMH